MTDKEFLLKEIENLKEEINILKKNNKNNIMIKVIFDENIIEINTGIESKLIEGKYYYLADNYKKPTKVKFLRYEILGGCDNNLVICCSCINQINGNFEYYFPKNLHKTKNQAQNVYLVKKYGDENV